MAVLTLDEFLKRKKKDTDTFMSEIQNQKKTTNGVQTLEDFAQKKNLSTDNIYSGLKKATQQAAQNTLTVTPQTDRSALQKQAEQNVAKQFGTYEEFAKKNSAGKVAVTAEASNKISQTTYKKLIEEETNRLASGSEFYGITNEGYREYLDNFSRNAKDDKQKEWLKTQKQNLEMLKDEKIRSKVEGVVYANKTSMRKNDGSLIHALSKQLKMSYEQAESLYDTVKREQNAKQTQTMLGKADELTEKGVLGKAGAQLLSVGANMTSTLSFLESFLQNEVNAVKGKYEPIDTNSFGYMSGKFRDKARGNIEADIEGEDGSVLRKGLGILYQGATSSFDSLSQGLLLGPAGGLTAMASQAAGSSTEEAFERNGSNTKAFATGLTSGLIEAATEKMGLDNMWDILQNSGKAAMRSKLVNVLGQMAIEAGEEMTSEVANTIADRIINTTDSNWTQNKKSYMDSGMSEKEAFKKTMGDTVQQVLLAGAGGAAGGLFGGISSTMLSTGFTKNEQRVIDAEVDARVAEKAKNGKVSAKQKSDIRKAVESDLAKGYIGIDTIEKTLGGDTLQKYNSVVEQEENLTKQLKELGEKPNTVANAKQYEELSTKLKELQEKGEKNTLREQLSKEVSDLTVNDRLLRESYNEKGRRGQAFEADVSQYQKNQQETIQRAVDSGILNNTNRTHEFVDWIAKISAEKGVSFDFTNNERLKESGFAKEGVSVNGYVADGNVVLNVNSAKALNQVVGHEITHVLEGSELYTELQETVKAYATTKGEYQSKLEALAKVYEGIEGVNVEQELTADLIGEYLFTDETFVQQLSTQNRNMFQKIYDEIKYLLKTVTAGSKEARQLEKVKKVFEEAYRKDVKTTNKDMIYSLAEITGEKGDYGIGVVLDTELFNGVKPRDWNKIVREHVYNNMAGETLVVYNNGEAENIYLAKKNERVTKDGGNNSRKVLDKLARSKNGDNIRNLSVVHIDELAEVSKYSSENLENVHQWLDENGWEIRTAYAQDKKGRIYEMTLNIAKSRDGRNILYDINNIKEIDHGDVASKGLAHKNQSLRDSIPQNQQNATENKKNSLSKNGMLMDERGNEITLETSEMGNHGTLMAIRNINEAELRGMLELGGIPVPSIAITDPSKVDHSNFGSISVLFDKETIDPANRKNEVYDRDVWSSRFPTLDYEVDEAKASELYSRARKTGNLAFFNPVSLAPSNLEHKMRHGATAMIEELKNDYGMKNFFLAETSNPVKTVFTENRTEINQSDKERFDYVLSRMQNEIAEIKNMTGREWNSKYGEQYKNVLKEYWRLADASLSELEINSMVDSIKPFRRIQEVGKIQDYGQNGGVKTETIEDYQATKAEIDKKVNQQDYEMWLKDMFGGIEKGVGIPNGKDPYTASGNQRSFRELHDSYTLENLVKNMTKGRTTGSENALFGVSAGAISSNMATRFHSISDIKNAENRITTNADEVVKPITDRLYENINNLNKYYKEDSYNSNTSATEAIFEFSTKKLTESTLRQILNDYYFAADQIPRTELQAIINSLNELRDIPSDYFEAKPQRAVGLDEIQAIVLPNDTDIELKQELSEKGFYVIEYDPNLSGDRQNKINQFDDLKFSLSENDSASNTDGWNVSGKDIELEDIGPVQEDVDSIEQTEWDLLEEWLRESQEADKVGEVQQENVEQDSKPTIRQRNKAKLEKYENQLQNLQETSERRISRNEELISKREVEKRNLEQSYDEKIAMKREQYEVKKNKDTKAANALLSQMHNLELRKETRLSECDRDIQYYNSEIAYIREELSDRSQRLQERIDKMNSAEFRTAEQRQMKQEETRTFIQELIGDTSTWKDKKMGISYQMRTLRRNLRDIVRDSNGNPDYARADAIYEAIQGIYNRNEAALNREANQIKEKFRSMKINKAEDAYIQMLGEYRHNPDTTLTADVMDRYYKAHKDKIDMAKVETAIKEVRKVYDSLFYRTNQVLKEHGFKEMEYREGYFPHFTENKSKVAKFFEKALNWKTRDNSIPTDIAGLTEQFTPNRSYQSFDKHRTSDTTDYSFMKGLDTYVNGALDWIYHIEDIQRRRALENEIRYVHSDAGVKEKLDAIYKNEEYDADQMQEEIDKVLKEKNNPLNNFVSDLRKGTQNLAGKKDTADRGLENRTSRKIYSVMTNISNRTTANMVVGSISSATTNLIPITQSWGQVSPISSLYGMEQTIKSYIHDDGVVNQSDFLTNRLRQNENLYKTGWDKAGNALGIMMDVVDNFTSQTVWRSKYFENIKQGMSESEAIRNADQFAENLLAGRSRGNMPTIFNEKNPVTKVFTAFQLEVMNQYEYMFKDMPQDLKAESSGKMQLAGKLVKGYAGMYVGAYLYNALMSQLTGRDAAFDPIGILVDFLRDLGAFDDDDDKDEESRMLKALGIYDDEVDKSYLQAVKNLAGNVADEIPFIGGLLGGGRIPISSAIPYDNPVSMVSESISELAKAFDEDKEVNWKELTEEWTKPLTYLVMPLGGGQLRKTVQGLSMFSKDKEVTGSYTTSGKLRFPVEDTVGNRIKAGLFGQYANENAREYFDEERQPLSEKKTKEFAELDIPISEYWNIQDGMKNLKKIGEKADYIAGLDLPVEKKNILINNRTTRDDPIDLTDYSLYNDLDEMDFAIKNPGKYSIAKATGGYEAYKGYQKALNNIHANKDSNGNAISGSRKEKVIDYLNGLTVDYGTRMILYRQQFNGDSTYNQEIVEYLDGREDMSYSEKEKILTELGFTVESDGTVRWKK